MWRLRDQDGCYLPALQPPTRPTLGSEQHVFLGYRTVMAHDSSTRRRSDVNESRSASRSL